MACVNVRSRTADAVLWLRCPIRRTSFDFAVPHARRLVSQPARTSPAHHELAAHQVVARPAAHALCNPRHRSVRPKSLAHSLAHSLALPLCHTHTHHTLPVPCFRSRWFCVSGLASCVWDLAKRVGCGGVDSGCASPSSGVEPHRSLTLTVALTPSRNDTTSSLAPHTPSPTVRGRTRHASRCLRTPVSASRPTFCMLCICRVWTSRTWPRRTRDEAALSRRSRLRPGQPRTSAASEAATHPRSTRLRRTRSTRRLLAAPRLCSAAAVPRSHCTTRLRP